MTQYATVTIRLPADLKKALEIAAAKEERTVTKYVERALRAALGLSHDS